MIVCTQNCVYQNSGICELTQAASSGRKSNRACRNCVPKAQPTRSVPGQRD